MLVDGLSAAIFRGGMHPVDLAGRLVRQADLLVTEGPAGASVPNHFIVLVNPRDLAADVDRQALDGELGRALAATAAERGWRTGGEVSVHVASDPAVNVGSIGCTTDTVPGPMPAWAQLIDALDGSVYEIGDNRALVGRSSKADISLPQAEVSRRHAVIYRRAGGVWIVDLGSANGTIVNGVKVDGEPMALRTGDQIVLGSATLTLRFI